MDPASKPTADPVIEIDNLATLCRLVGRFAPVKAAAALVFTVLLVRSALEIAHPMLIARVIDELVGFEGTHGPLPGAYVTMLLVLAGVIVGRGALFYVSGVLAARVSQDVENRLRTDLFEQRIGDCNDLTGVHPRTGDWHDDAHRVR